MFLAKSYCASNNPGDWGDGKLKSAYGMKKKEKMSVTMGKCYKSRTFYL